MIWLCCCRRAQGHPSACAQLMGQHGLQLQGSRLGAGRLLSRAGSLQVLLTLLVCCDARPLILSCCLSMLHMECWDSAMPTSLPSETSLLCCNCWWLCDPMSVCSFSCLFVLCCRQGEVSQGTAFVNGLWFFLLLFFPPVIQTRIQEDPGVPVG